MENKLTSPAQNSFMANYEKTDDILKDMCGIIESSRDRAYKAVNTALIQRNWRIGYPFQSPKVPDGVWKGLCLCRTTAAHSHRKARLLYRSGVLQLHSEVLYADRSEDRKDYPR